jgi:hypothetical protein
MIGNERRCIRRFIGRLARPVATSPARGYPGAQEPLVQVAQARDDGPDISAFICS